MQKFDVAEVGSGWGLSLGLVKEGGFYGDWIYQVNHNKYDLYSKNNMVTLCVWGFGALKQGGKYGHDCSMVSSIQVATPAGWGRDSRDIAVGHWLAGAAALAQDAT
ncbi:hypothetical protein [Rhodoferax sp.]|uniref:hypothetical protein n=1 Tax=Rhodoferax sp. TaxID=50421 RepID=UPI0025DF8884|nr:hypothetical protein [Rhodoferax sp.]MCM2341274.1 hypothetical protein [Rhodoferax sp.]